MLKKGLEKKMFFYWCSYTLCIQTIMNTNKVNVSARLLFIKHDQDARQVLTWHLLITEVYGNRLSVIHNPKSILHSYAIV